MQAQPPQNQQLQEQQRQRLKDRAAFAVKTAVWQQRVKLLESQCKSLVEEGERKDRTILALKVRARPWFCKRSIRCAWR